MRDKSMKVFYKNLWWKGELRQLSALQVLYILMFRTKYNDAEIILQRGEKKKIADQLEISRAAVSHGFSILEKYGIVVKKISEDGTVEKNHYILNTVMYWYGDLYIRKRAIKKYNYLFHYW